MKHHYKIEQTDHNEWLVIRDHHMVAICDTKVDALLLIDQMEAADNLENELI
jgi:hypothetical protein